MILISLFVIQSAPMRIGALLFFKQIRLSSFSKSQKNCNGATAPKKQKQKTALFQRRFFHKSIYIDP